MKTESVKIEGTGYYLSGTIIKPEVKEKIPAVIFYHGMISQSKPRYVKRGEELAKAGIASLCFDLRACGESDGEFGKLSLKNWFDDAVLAYDYLMDQSFVDNNRIGICGKSFGGYMGVLVCGKRNVRSMVLQAPGVYPDDWFNEKYTWDDDFSKRRYAFRKSERALDNIAIRTIEKFKNPLLIVGSELDDTCPRNVIEGFYNRTASKNKKLEWIKGADYALIDEKYNQEFTKMITDWFKKTL